MEVVIIKYNAGNIQSVKFALERMNVSAIVTDDIDKIQSADKIIFPGVGEASTAMNYLQEKKLDKLIPTLTKPVLGICLGMQLMCKYSEENDTECMGIFDADVKLFSSGEKEQRLKVPQIGWNTIHDLRSPLFMNVPENSYCYFVHGYYAELNPYCIAVTNYPAPYSSALRKKNFYGVQFHPEKSAVVGEQILKNFLAI
ncbi:MAG TPA: imidazole glycerol phosphate synthase subunit HisH [Chitinophagaceae bacterium]|nr:imidazole glycerol phosphate synthase subunit HisH [Chitinophagaceae bacterium]